MNTDETRKLDWSWAEWEYRSSDVKGGGVAHYANLTRGVKCAPRNAHLCRIQSTQCEAKVWDRVLMSIPDEMIARVALGQYVVVHDYSEKPRETRAMWQGLTLARIMMEFRWFGELRSKFSSSRGGKTSIQYLRNVASKQDEQVKRKYDYFREVAQEADTTYTSLVSCWKANGNKNCTYYRPAVTPQFAVDRPPSNLW